ncbi:MAG: DUF1592 domain-containing protein [Polyangiaceae bacterium]
MRIVNYSLPGLAAVIGVLAAGCVGDITTKGGEGGGSTPGPGPVESTPVFACKAGVAPEAVPLRRLTRVQLENSYRDLIVGVLPQEADQIWSQLQPVFDAVPADPREGPNHHWGGFTRVSQSVTQQHADRVYDLAVSLGKELTSTDARLAAVAGACAADADGSNDDVCLDDFIRTFGERVMRRAISDEDVSFYREVAGAAPFDRDDWADVASQFFAAPHFLFFVEHGEQAATTAKDVYQLGAYELAARLSYHFWQSTPDEELLGTARSGDLLKPEVYDAQITRLFEDPRSRATVRQFFAEWFLRSDVAQLNSLLGTPAFDALRGDLTPSAQLRQDMFDEVADMGTYYGYDQSSQFDEIFTSTKSFARSDELAQLYGVGKWDGSTTPPDFAEPERRGLLTRGAMLVTGSANTRPIMKGVFVRRALLCDDLAPPPANVMAVTPELATDATSREVVEALTGGGSCANCHTAQINPLGFATENFDALGRPRQNEKLIDLLTGEVKGEKPVDTQVTPRIDIEDGSTQVSDGLELQDQMLKSGKLHSCFARLYFRFTFGREENIARDACELADLHGRMLKGQSLRDVIRAVALTPAFRERNFGE